MIKRAVFAFVILSLVVAAACRPPAEAPQGTQQPVGTGNTPAKPTATKPATPPSGQPKGQVLRKLWDDPPTLDPALTGDTTSAALVVEIFSGLVSLGTDMTIQPEIAQTWDVSPDGKTYTFKLNPNAKFQDGKPVTATDFKYSMERAANPRTESTVADTYLGDIVGARDVLNGKATQISGIKVVDPQTLQITIDAPKVYFLAKMTYPTAYVVDKANIEGSRNWTAKPNGTGPFALKTWQIGQQIVLQRNANYYKEPAKLDQVQMVLSGGVGMTMYENGEIDTAGVGLADLDRVKNPQDPLNKELRKAPPGFDISYIGFNVNQAPFDDVNVRKALSAAINKETIAQNVYSNLVLPAYGILPPGFPGYNDKLQGYKFDLAAAKQYLAQSKYQTAAKLPRMVMTIAGTGGTPNLDLEAILEMWKTNLGITVELQQTDWATFLDDMSKKKFQTFNAAWQADYPDPENFLDVLFYSKSFNNETLYSNPEVDQMLVQARSIQDSVQRIALYQQIEQKIVNDAPWIPLWYSGEGYVLIKPYVKDYRLVPLVAPKLRYVSIQGR